VTFEDLAYAYVAESELREHRTRSTARARGEHLRQCFHEMPAATITAAPITRDQTSRRQGGAAAATVNRETAARLRLLMITRRTAVSTRLSPNGGSECGPCRRIGRRRDGATRPHDASRVRPIPHRYNIVNERERHHGGDRRLASLKDHQRL
jgi:hypothetical protein